MLRPLYDLAPPRPPVAGQEAQQQQKQFVWVGAPSADPATPAVVAIPIATVSGTNPLEGQLWETAGSAEAEELRTWLHARQQALLLSTVCGTAASSAAGCTSATHTSRDKKSPLPAENDPLKCVAL